MVVLRLAGNVGRDVPVELEPPSDAGADQGIQAAEHGRAPDPVAPSGGAPHLLGGQLAARRDERLGDAQAMWRGSLPGGAQAFRHHARPGHTLAPTAPATTEKP